MSEQQLQSDYTLNPQFSLLRNCIENNAELRFVLVSLPVHKLYADARYSAQIEYVDNCIQSLISLNENVAYYNLDTLALSETDFKDTDHLSKTGADKISSLLNKIITRPEADYIGDVSN